MAEDTTLVPKVVRPRRLDLKELPRDKQRVLGGLREKLVHSYNYCRKYPLKMLMLKKTLERVLAEINKYEDFLKKAEAEHDDRMKKAKAAKLAEAERKAKAEAEKKAATEAANKSKLLLDTIAAFDDKTKLDEFAKQYNIDLDARKNIDGMKADLIEGLKELAAKKATDEGGQ
jgi:membrane protein involved in colicin uptake